MNIAPKMYVTTYHSRMPHCLICRSDPVRPGWNRSAFQTPIWHHTELMTRTRVLQVANGTLSLAGSETQRAGTTERIVKYIANRPAKNISSLASHTIVPTDVMFGRLTGAWCGASTADAVATAVIIALPGRSWCCDPPGMREIASLAMATTQETAAQTLTVLLYSDDSSVREKVRLA